MQPYSIDTASEHAARMVPTTQINNDNPTLPADLTMVPGVAKMPLPMTRDTTRMYALIQVRCLRWLSTGASFAPNKGCRSCVIVKIPNTPTHQMCAPDTLETVGCLEIMGTGRHVIPTAGCVCAC